MMRILDGSGRLLVITEEGLRRLYEPLVSVYGGQMVSSSTLLSITSVVYYDKGFVSEFGSRGAAVSFADTIDHIKLIVSGVSGGLSMSQPKMLESVSGSYSAGVSSVLTSVLSRSLALDYRDLLGGVGIVLGGELTVSSNSSVNAAQVVSYTGRERLLAYEVLPEGYFDDWSDSLSFSHSYEIAYLAPTQFTKE